MHLWFPLGKKNQKIPRTPSINVLDINLTSKFRCGIQREDHGSHAGRVRHRWSGGLLWSRHSHHVCLRDPLRDDVADHPRHTGSDIGAHLERNSQAVDAQYIRLGDHFQEAAVPTRFAA